MPKNIGGYSGYSEFTDDNFAVTGISGNRGVWDLRHQFYFERRNNWQYSTISATGGNTVIDTVENTRLHIFTSPGTFTVSSVGSGLVDYFVVGGGGGGGDAYQPSGAFAQDRAGGAGGGAGGLRTGSFTVSATSYNISIGGGGGVARGGGGYSDIVGIVTAEGGGGGGNGYYVGGPTEPGMPGGSGGGGAETPNSYTIRTGGTGNRVVNTTTVVPSQGNPGANGTFYSGGPGGGGGAGQTGTSGIPSKGGNGLTCPFYVPITYGTPGPTPGRWFAGGGSGNPYFKGSEPGGAGGGGRAGGGTDVPVPAAQCNGGDNTGGGAGGRPGQPAGGGYGGSGIVIIKYPI